MNICCLSPVSPLVLFHHIHFFYLPGHFFGTGGFCPRGVLAEEVFVQVFFVQGGLCPRFFLSKVVYVLGGFWRGGFWKGGLGEFFCGKVGFGKGAYVLLPGRICPQHPLAGHEDPGQNRCPAPPCWSWGPRVEYVPSTPLLVMGTQGRIGPQHPLAGHGGPG